MKGKVVAAKSLPAVLRSFQRERKLVSFLGRVRYSCEKLLTLLLECVPEGSGKYGGQQG